MDFIHDNIIKWIKELLTNGIIGNLDGAFADIGVARLRDLVKQSPAEFAGGSVWQIAIQTAQSVMMPIAALVLTAAMCIQLIGWVNERNNMSTVGDVGAYFIRYIIRLFVGVLLVQRSPEITQGIFDLGNYIVSMVPAGGGGELGGAPTAQQMQAMLEGKELMDLIYTFFFSIIGGIGITVLNVVAQLMIIGRLMKIALYVSVGAVPYATLTVQQHEVSRIGVNYLKNLFALAFQGFFMFVIIIMYSALVGNAFLDGDLIEILKRTLLYTAVLAFALINSASLSKSIFDAH